MDCSKTGIIFHHRAEFKHNLSELQTYHRTDGSLSANVSDIALTAQLEENNEPWVSNMGLSESSAVVFLSPGGLVGSKMASLGPIIARIAIGSSFQGSSARHASICTSCTGSAGCENI